MHAYDFAVPIYVLNERRAVARIGISFEREWAAIHRTRNLVLSLGVVALLVGLALARLQARGVTRAVGQLVRGAGEITKGNLDHRISVNAGGELGQVAFAFNRMTQSIQALIDTSRELSSELDSDIVLRSIAAYALTLVKADVVAIAPYDERRGRRGSESSSEPGPTAFRIFFSSPVGASEAGSYRPASRLSPPTISRNRGLSTTPFTIE